MHVAHGSRWLRSSGLSSLLVALIVGALGFFLDRVLIREGIPRFGMLLISSGLTGLFAGGLFYRMVREERASRERVRERMRTVAELNHHIRNALQVIKFLGGKENSSLDAAQLQLINDSVDRIEWALRSVLPPDRIGSARPMPSQDAPAPLTPKVYKKNKAG